MNVKRNVHGLNSDNYLFINRLSTDIFGVIDLALTTYDRPGQ